MEELQPPRSYDPYDLWTTGIGVYAKRHFYQGKLHGKLLALVIGVVDWLLPYFSRRIFGAEKRSYPITVAQWILSQPGIEDRGEVLLKHLLATASSKKEEFGAAWGLGFPWMSKNGLYDEDMPFVTHTPYALEALLRLYKESSSEVTRTLALQSFRESKLFLDKLKVMHEDETTLALSYAPIVEPRMVVNANSYACFTYALHARYEESEAEAQRALSRAEKLLNWVVKQQQQDGSWFYYADAEPGNFIDGFHSCFVLKNLLKTAQLAPQFSGKVTPAIEAGIAYLSRAFVDTKTGLLRRFTERDIKDPFVWDLYDQAEYLGLLVLRGEITQAQAFLETVRRYFYKNGCWYARIDFIGRRWGRNFARWGIMPLQHQIHELEQVITRDKQ